MQIDTETGEPRIVLPVHVDLPASVALRDALLHALDGAEYTHIELDASHVERLSTAAAQVMVAAKMEFTDKDKALRFTHCSDAFMTAWKQLGLDSDSLE